VLRTRAADTSLASDHMWPHPKAVHMNASDQNTAAHILQEGAVHICRDPKLRYYADREFAGRFDPA